MARLLVCSLKALPDKSDGLGRGIHFSVVYGSTLLRPFTTAGPTSLRTNRFSGIGEICQDPRAGEGQTNVREGWTNQRLGTSASRLQEGKEKEQKGQTRDPLIGSVSICWFLFVRWFRGIVRSVASNL